MKSIPLALTWEFWTRAWSALFATVICCFGLITVFYGGLRVGNIQNLHPAQAASLNLLGFIFVAIGLSAAICHSSGSPQLRFSLPVSTHASILIPMINGAIATAVGYVILALFANWVFDAQWTLVKPAITAVCMISLCQAVGWACCGATSPNLRGAVDVGFCTVLGVGVILLNEPNYRTPVQQSWHTIRPLDISLAMIDPIFAFSLAFVTLTLARRGQMLSMTAMGRRLLAKLDLRFKSGTSGRTPMAAELWSDWTVRGRVMPAMPLLVATIMCGFFLSGRFTWEAARDGIIALTWLQVMIGAILGLFIGHVGERFDFHEYSATRPLSDMQLADVKLRNALKAVVWTWTMWAIGIAVMIACLALVGQRPASWSDIIPPETPRFVAIVSLVMIPLCSWTLTSLGVSIVILRPWLVKTVLCTLALLPFVPYAFLFSMPDSEKEILAASQWGWICLTIGGTVALYVIAFRLRLIKTKRLAIVSVSYVSFCAAWLSLVSFRPPVEISLALVIGWLLSSCILPFVCVAAVPLAIWWNRHR